MWAASEGAHKCVLCHKSYERMVQHLKTVHENHEIFISRISESMANHFKSTKSTSFPVATLNYDKKLCKQNLTMICPFCEDEKTFYMPYWPIHLRRHTGEYTNECITCGIVSLSYTHCGRSTLKKTYNLYDNGLIAFICTICNYVQFNEKRMHSHLKLQHELMSLKNHYKMIRFIPPLKDVSVQRSTSNALIQGM